MSWRRYISTVRTSLLPSSVGDGLALAAAVLGPLLLYALTLPRTVVLEDDGLFLMAGAHLGVAHPPGYPLYTLLCHLVTWVPFGTVAFLGHLSSAILGALACGGVYLCARLLQAAPIPAVTAAWLFAASEHVWAQAIIAEVYTLNALLFFATYGLILYGVRHPARSRLWMAAAAGYGLSLANHWPLMGLALPGLLLAVLPAWKSLPVKLPKLVAVSLVSAALPYAWMVVRSWQEPFISFYGPITDWEAFWYYVSRSGYSKVDVSPSADWSDRLAFLGWFGNEVIWQVTLPGFALAALGVYALFRCRRYTEAGSGLLVFLGNSAVLIVLLRFDFDDYNVSVFRPYSLVSYGIVSLWLAVGLQFLLDRLPTGLRAGPWVRTGAAALAGLGMVTYSVQANWGLNDRSGSDFSERYSEVMFDLLPQDAVLFVFGDSEIGPLGYYRFVEQRRPDVTLLSAQGLVYGNRLYRPRTSDRRKAEALRRFVNETDRPVFYTIEDEKIPHDGGSRRHGFVKEVIREGASGAMELRIQPQAERYFEELLNRRPVDSWERFRRHKLLYLYGEHLGYAVLSGNAELLERTRRTLALARRSFFSLIGMVEVLLNHGNRSHLAQIDEWMQEADHMQDEIMSKERMARFLYLKGFLRYRLGRADEAVALFRKSLAIYPHPDNASIMALKQIAP